MDQFLKEIFSRYADVPNEELNRLVIKLKTVRIEKGCYFLHQGDTINRFGLIMDGLFRIYCTDIKGDEKTLSFRNRGQFLAGYSPYIQNRSIWYSMQALEDAEVIVIKFEDYQKLVNRHHCWNELIKNYITELFIEKEQRERSLLLEDAASRYLNFLKTYPDYESKISQYHIASYLGITPVSLSRIRSRMKNKETPAN